MNELNSYDLSHNFFNWCFENPEKITPTHIAMYFFIIEHCNRLGWKEKFGLPTTMVKDAIGIRNYRTYSNTLNDLVKWGFIKMIEKSKNQYSSNIIAIVKYTKASTKALDKALQKHSQKQSESIDSILKQETINKEQYNNDDDVIFVLNSISYLFDKKYINDDTKKVLFKLLNSYTKEQIIDAVKWAKNDSFWSSNFLSLNKLNTTDKNKVKYIDIFISKMGNNNNLQFNAITEEFKKQSSNGLIDLSKMYKI